MEFGKWWWAGIVEGRRLVRGKKRGQRPKYARTAPFHMVRGYTASSLLVEGEGSWARELLVGWARGTWSKGYGGRPGVSRSVNVCFALWWWDHVDHVSWFKNAMLCYAMLCTVFMGLGLDRSRRCWTVHE